MVKEEFLGQEDPKKNLLAFFDLHNSRFLGMVGVTRSIHTYNKYRSVQHHCNNTSVRVTDVRISDSGR